MEALTTRGTFVSDDYLLNLTNLTKLSVSCCNNITGNSFENFKKELNISYTENINEEYLKKLNLKLLYAFDCYSVYSKARLIFENKKVKCYFK